MNQPKRIVRARAAPNAPPTTPASPPENTARRPARPIRRVAPSAPVTAPVKRVIPIQPEPASTSAVNEDGTPRTDYAAVIERYRSKVTNRASAIRAHCVVCSNGSLSEVRNCTVTKCVLHPFRLGADPFRKKRSDAKDNDQPEGEDE